MNQQLSATITKIVQYWGLREDRQNSTGQEIQLSELLLKKVEKTRQSTLQLTGLQGWNKEAVLAALDPAVEHCKLLVTAKKMKHARGHEVDQGKIDYLAVRLLAAFRHKHGQIKIKRLRARRDA